MDESYSVVIVGGGIVGMTAALAFVAVNPALRIALVESRSFSNHMDHRLIALHYASHCLLKNVGIWETLSAIASPIHAIHVSDKGHFGVTRIRAQELDIEALGYLVPAQDIYVALVQALEKKNQITLLSPAHLENFSEKNNEITLTLKMPEGLHTIRTSLLIGADGTYSTVRKLAGISASTVETGQSALVTTIDLKRPHQACAYERFVGSSVIALLPRSDNRCALIWSGDAQALQAKMVLSESTFMQQLQDQFGYRLGRFVGMTERYLYPLQKTISEKIVKNNVVLIGNAAHTIHPVAAQGLNLGLYDTALLADILMTQKAPYDFSKMIAWQGTYQQKIIRFSSSLVPVFTSDFVPTVWMRNMGMIALDSCPLVKKRLVQWMMGGGQQKPFLEIG